MNLDLFVNVQFIKLPLISRKITYLPIFGTKTMATQESKTMFRFLLPWFVVQFFTWLALFAMWIYATPGLAQNLAGTTDTTSKAYNEIGNWVGVLFGFYNGFSGQRTWSTSRSRR